MITPEKIEENYKRFVTLTEKTGEHAEPLKALIEHFGDRLVECPASSKADYYCAYLGGLIDHSLQVLNHMVNLAKTYTVPVPKESLVLVSLYHDIGKMGGLNEGEQRYLLSTNSYQIERGNLFEYNKKNRYLTPAHQSLFLLQHFGVRLNEEEFMAILLSSGTGVDENRSYALQEPMLALLLAQAKRIAMAQK